MASTLCSKLFVHANIVIVSELNTKALVSQGVE